MSEFVYRRPEPRDIPALCELGRVTFIETFGHLYSDKDRDDFFEKRFGPDGLPREYRDPSFEFRICEAGGELVAYCKVGPPDPDLPIPADGRRQCELWQLYILKAWHGRGIAQAMMDWALGWARDGDFDDMYLSVYQENKRAQKLYQNYGFEKVGEFDFMVGSQADPEFLYRLKLRP